MRRRFKGSDAVTNAVTDAVDASSHSGWLKLCGEPNLEQ